MSSNGLGWWAAQPITDKNKIAELLCMLANTGSANAQRQVATSVKPMVGVVNTIAGKSLSLKVLIAGIGLTPVSMGRPPKLTGAEFLWRMHVVLGHPGMAVLLLTVAMMKAAGDDIPVLTTADVEAYVRQGCGICDSVKMKRKPFKLLEDKTKPLPGKVWVGDSIELRKTSAEKGYKHIMRYICKGSDMKVSYGMLGLTSGDCIKSEDELRADVRPIHGELMILRLDNLPGQKSKAVEDYHAGKQTSMEWSAPDCHEGATLAEVSFMHDVPKTLACLKQAPDLNDKRHYYQA